MRFLASEVGRPEKEPEFTEYPSAAVYGELGVGSGEWGETVSEWLTIFSERSVDGLPTEAVFVAVLLSPSPEI